MNPAMLLQEIILKILEIGPQRHICTSVSMQTHSQQIKGREHSSRGKQKVGTMEYYSALKRQEILAPATLQSMKQSQNKEHCDSTYTRDKGSQAISSRWQKNTGNTKSLLPNTEFQFCKMKNLAMGPPMYSAQK
jgi:hypothetical protein